MGMVVNINGQLAVSNPTLKMVNTPLGLIVNEELPQGYVTPVKNKVAESVAANRKTLNINPVPQQAQQTTTPFEPVVITPALNANNLAASAGATIGMNLPTSPDISNKVVNISTPNVIAGVPASINPGDSVITASNKAQGANLTQPNLVPSFVLSAAEKSALNNSITGLADALNMLPANKPGILDQLSTSPLIPNSSLLSKYSTVPGLQATINTSPYYPPKEKPGDGNVGNYNGSNNLPDAQGPILIGAPLTQTQDNSIIPSVPNNILYIVAGGLVVLLIFKKLKKRK